MRLLVPVILGIVIVSAMAFSVFPVFTASTIHTATANNIDDQDQIVTFTFHDTESTGDVFFTPSVTNGWTGKVTVFLCDESADPNLFAIKADTTGNNVVDSTVLSFDPTSAGCFSQEGQLPDGTDRISFRNDDAVPNWALVTLHLDNSPELP